MNIEEYPESIFSPDGIHVDFVSGIRLGFPENTETFRYKFTNADTGEIYDSGVAEGEDREVFYYTKRKYFTRWTVELYRNGKWYFKHTFDARGKHVFIDLSFGALGDSVAWLPAAVRFFKKWDCRGIVCMKPEHIPLFRDCYPEIQFVTPSEETTDLSTRCYARYGVAVIGYGDTFLEVIDFRKNNLIRHAEMILGMEPDKNPPKIIEGYGETPKEIDGKPYVCIATRASRHCKEYHFADGWRIICEKLKERGFVPVCIDGDNINMPEAACVDCTGMRPLPGRVKLLHGAAFFIGLPSGLSWVAWACGIPVILISGFTDPYVEFETPYRVSPPPGVCHGCWGTLDHRGSDFDKCIRGLDNECTKRITPDMILEACDRAIADHGIRGAESAIQEDFPVAGEKKTCPICGEKTARFTAVKWDKKSSEPQEAKWRYYHCRNCGCFFLDEMRGWNPEMFAEKVYNSEYGKVDVEFDGTRSKKLLPAIVRILEQYEAKRILDYGGGGGSLADLLREKGYDAYCFDPFGRQDVSGDAGDFDCVIAVEVLEHIIEARELWAEISGKLKPGGIFLATTSLHMGRSLDKWPYANPRAGHCMLYSAAALTIAAASVNMRGICKEGDIHIFRKVG